MISWLHKNSNSSRVIETRRLALYQSTKVTSEVLKDVHIYKHAVCTVIFFNLEYVIYPYLLRAGKARFAYRTNSQNLHSYSWRYSPIPITITRFPFSRKLFRLISCTKQVLTEICFCHFNAVILFSRLPSITPPWLSQLFTTAIPK